MVEQSRRGRNWLLIVLGGCAGLVLLGVIAAAAIVFLVFGAIKRSEVYEQALARAQASPSATAALGEPIESGWLVGGNIETNAGGGGQANLSIPVSGPSGEGRLYASAVREAGSWTFTSLLLEVAGGDTLDLLAETGGAGVAASAAAGDLGTTGTAATAVAPAASGAVIAALEQITGPAPADVTVDPTTTLWVEREYSAWENPLHSEMAINGTTINIFTSDTFQPVAQYLRPGWNTIAITTTPQEPATSDNGLIFRIGPAQDDGQGHIVMNPVLWTLRNDTDWQLEDGVYTHPLEPSPKQVTLTYHLFYGGLAHEARALEPGDYVLQGGPQFSSWSSPLVGTVVVNGRALTSFVLEERQLVIDDLLQQGRNEVKLLATLVDGAFADNDVHVAVGGPAEWNENQERFLLTPIAELHASAGWSKDPETQQLVNPQDPAQRVMVRSAPFFLETAPDA